MSTRYLIGGIFPTYKGQRPGIFQVGYCGALPIVPWVGDGGYKYCGALPLFQQGGDIFFRYNDFTNQQCF